MYARDILSRMSTPTPEEIVSAPTPVDYMSAAAEILAAIAWPVAILTLVLVFRKPLLGALRGLVEFKWGSASFTFDRKLDQLAESVAGSGDLPDKPREIWRTLASSSEGDDPRTVIIKSYVALEQWVLENFPAQGIPATRGDRSRPLMEMVREAVNQGKLAPTMVTQVQGLQTLRNLAVHSPTDPTREQATEFETLAGAVLYMMQSAFERN